MHGGVPRRLSSGTIRVPVPIFARMLAGSLALSAALAGLVGLGACATRNQTNRDRANADRSAKADAETLGERQPKPTSERTPEREAVNVVAIDPSEAWPCERMCGRIGDCLQTDRVENPASATGVEFACLDTCVYADPLNPAAAAFQACETATECGELLGCARARWDAATAARRAVEIPTEFAVVRDICETACLGLQSCSFFYKMPNEIAGMATADFYSSVDMCTEGCRSMGDQVYAPYAPCIDEPTCDQFYSCPGRMGAFP